MGGLGSHLRRGCDQQGPGKHVAALVNETALVIEFKPARGSGHTNIPGNLAETSPLAGDRQPVLVIDRRVLDGDIKIQNHCYRADEMAIVLDMAKEFGYTVSTFHHAVESYKIADLLRDNGVCSAVWADWWG